MTACDVISISLNQANPAYGIGFCKAVGGEGGLGGGGGGRGRGVGAGGSKCLAMNLKTMTIIMTVFTQQHQKIFIASSAHKSSTCK